MRRFTRALLAAALLCFTLGLAACGTESGGEATKIDLIIGVSVPPGEESDTGSRAADAALEEIDAAIKEADADHTVKLEKDDEGEQPAEAAEAVSALAAKDASCITGGWSDAAFAAQAEAVAAPGDALLISPAATGVGVSAGADPGFVSRTVPGPNVEGPALAALVADSVGKAEGSTVTLASQKDDYGTAYTDAFTGAWEDEGGEVDGGEADDASVVVATPGAPLETTGTGRGIAAENTFVNSAYASNSGADDAPDGVAGVMPGAPDGKEGEAFAKLMPDSQEKEPAGPSFEAQAFDAVVICYLAAVESDSTSPATMADAVGEVTGPPGDEYGFDELATAIEAMENGDEIDYVGASGQIDMDIDGNPTVGTYDGFEISDGALSRTDKQFTGEAAEE